MPGRNFSLLSPSLRRVKPEQEDLIGRSFDGFRTELTFLNFTNENVYFKTVMGLSVTVEPHGYGFLHGLDREAMNEYTNSVVIRQTIRCTESQKIDILTNLQATKTTAYPDSFAGESPNTEFSRRVTSFTEALRSSEANAYAQCSVCIDYIYRDFKRALLTTGSENHIVCAVTGTIMGLVTTTSMGVISVEENLRKLNSIRKRFRENGAMRSATTIDILLVSRQGDIGRKYVKVAGLVVEVRPVSPSDVEGGPVDSGVIVLLADGATDGVDLETRVVLWEPLSFAKPENGFYETIEDAENGTDLKYLSATLERESLRAKAARENEKLEQQREADERKERSEQRKEKAEERQSKTRSFQDFMKLAVVTIPLVITVGKTIAKFWRGVAVILAAGAAAKAGGT